MKRWGLAVGSLILCSMGIIMLRPAIMSPPTNGQRDGTPTMTVWNAGEVRKRETLHHTFRIGNDSITDMFIQKVRSTCSCTTAVVPGTRVPAGGAVKVGVSVRVGDTAGSHAQQVMVQTDHRKYPERVLRVEYHVLGDVTCSPKHIAFGTFVSGLSPKRSAILRNETSKAVRVTGVQFPRERFDIAIGHNGDVGKDGDAVDGLRIDVAVKKNVLLGRFEDAVRLFLESDQQEELTIYVSGEVTPDWAVWPSRVCFGAVKLGSGERAVDISVESFRKEPLRVTSASSTNGAVSVQLVRHASAGNIAEVRVTLTPSLVNGLGYMQSRIRLEVDGGVAPVLWVPVSWYCCR